MRALSSTDVTEEFDKTYNAKLDIWHYMSYSVAKMLHIRPLTILMDWSCEELLISFGVYMNEIMSERYAEYEALDSKAKSKVKVAPTPYAVQFVTFEQLEMLHRPKSAEELQSELEERLKIEAFMKGGGKIG